MARLVVGVLIGLVLGLYLNGASTNVGAPILAQLEATFGNLVQF